MEDKFTDLFLEKLKISLVNASVYPKEHPFFIKSVEVLENTIRDVMGLSSELRIDISLKYLSVGGATFKEKKLYEDIAGFFHRRKVKSIIIRQKVSVDELTSFLNLAGLSPKDIFFQGGLKRLILQAKISHIKAEDLDYSQFLKGIGGEQKDIWAYIFKNAVDRNDSNQIEQLSGGFKAIIDEFKDKDVWEDSEVTSNVFRFLEYLKNNKKDKFRKCAKELLKTILGRKSSSDQVIEDIKNMLKSLSNEDLADTLWEKIIEDNDFDALSFQLFSKLIDTERHKKVSPALYNNMKKGASTNIFLSEERAKEIFSSSLEPFISDIYKNVLSLSIQSISKEGTVSLKRQTLEKNYFYILLALFSKEEDGIKAKRILKTILSGAEAAKNKDWCYLKDLLSVCKDKKQRGFLNEDFEDIENSIGRYFKDAVLKGEDIFSFDFFLSFVNKEYFSSNNCLDNIFNKNNINSNLLKLFFSFFPDKINVFCKLLRAKMNDIGFMKAIVNSLKDIDSPLTYKVFKYLFPLSGIFVKMEILRAMKNISFRDDDFIIKVIKKEAYLLKREGFQLLKADEAKEKILKSFFVVFNPFGMKNNVLEENMKLVKELRSKEALKYLEAISKNRWFWNKRIRHRAKNILDGLRDER